MKQPHEVFDKEAFVARLMAIGTKPKPQPKPATARLTPRQIGGRWR